MSVPSQFENLNINLECTSVLSNESVEDAGQGCEVTSKPSDQAAVTVSTVVRNAVTTAQTNVGNFCGTQDATQDAKLSSAGSSCKAPASCAAPTDAQQEATGAVPQQQPDTLEPALKSCSTPAVHTQQPEQPTAPPCDNIDGSSSSSSSSSSGDESDVMPVIEAPPSERSSPAELQPPQEPVDGDRKVGILYDESMELHRGPGYPDHYEQPQRVIQVFVTLAEEELLQRCFRLPGRLATDEELQLAHTAEHITYVDTCYDSRPEDKADDPFIRQGADLYVCQQTAKAARMAAGCCVQAVQSVLEGTMQSAVAIVRPPGHHAECARAQGFCFFNNCAVAARAALQHPGVSRVLIFDWDVHSGNGIQEVLWEDPSVLYISVHRDPTKFYPFTAGFVSEVGGGAGEGFNVNVPWLKRGMGDVEYSAAFDLVVEPIIRSYKPDLIIVAAGFDAAEGDPLGGCKLTPEGYAAMTRRLMSMAEGKVVLCLEGGYNTRVTGACMAECVRALLEGCSSPHQACSPEDSGEANDKAGGSSSSTGTGSNGGCCFVVEQPKRKWPAGEAVKTLRQVSEVQAKYWPVLNDPPFEKRWAEYEASLLEGPRKRGISPEVSQA